jgi:murein DD-endopeptidase MepM/ murein hydrolase activator NlpD
MKRAYVALVLCVSLLAPLSFVPTESVRADTIDTIKEQIQKINEERAKLDAEIAGYQKELNAIAGTKQTLQSTIQTLDVSRSKTAAQIKALQQKIAGANLKLSQLGFEINDKEQSVALNREAIAASLRTIESADDTLLLEYMLGAESLTDAWTAVDNLASLNSSLRLHTNALLEIKEVLADQQKSVTSTKNELSSATVDLESQKKALDINRQGKQQLLSQTQAQESSYQALLADRVQKQKEFDALLFKFEAALQLALDPSSIPTAQTGVLAYPVESIFVTQYFGKTVDAKRLYTSGTHGGVDFRAPIGTPIKSALAGTVSEIEATKIKDGCQYGKFVLIKHANGLSTIYGHLSQVSVNDGNSVTTGQTIGYSGNTGYSTGPHLHFGVYATQGIKVVTADQLGSTYCAGIKTVAANPDAYLDPMEYL